MPPSRAATPHPFILASATALPEHTITREDVKYQMGRVFDIPERKLEAMMSIVDNAQVHKRHSIFPITYTVELPDNHFTVSRIRTHRNGSITLNVKIPGPGTIDVLETAWKDNLATTAVLLQPAARRFVVARHHKSAPDATTLKLSVTPNKTGKRLVRQHTYRVTLRLWVSYTPTGGRFRKQGFYGLHLPR